MPTKARARALAAIAVLIGALSLGSLPSFALEFRIDEGRNINAFVRGGPVAAHLVLRSGNEPRILVVFPAGNSGVGLWFEQTRAPVAWTLDGPARAITRTDAKGRKLHGIEAQIVANVPALEIGQAVLSSVRVLRDYELNAILPQEIVVKPLVTRSGISWARDRLDGAPGYVLSIEPLDGTNVTANALASDGGRRLRLRLVALTGEKPLTALDERSLLTGEARKDERSRNVLEFLSYEEKYLAGSWRFDTYFGRDTLLSMTLLAPVLQPQAVESGIASVLARLSPEGEVAHEEDIGEFAILRNMRENRGRRDTPLYDYAMVDDDFLLAPLAAHWLLDDARGRARAVQFLARAHEGGRTNGSALVRNFRWLLKRTAAFAAEPEYRNLVGLKDGRVAGQWRDSREGLGGGRYAYDVNAVFVPAALEAVDRLVKSGLLEPYLSTADRRTLRRARAQARVWSTKAPSLFVTTIPADRARASVAAYAASVGVDEGAALASLKAAEVSFPALSLDASGQPIPVLHSDVGFALLFGSPSPHELSQLIEPISRPYPAGLMTPVGWLVANPAYAPKALQDKFTTSNYHGTVIWAWQHAVLAAGLSRQLAREDLPRAVRDELEVARTRLWAAIDATRSVRTTELWSWSYTGGEYRVEPFGQRGVDEDESNAAQLWSTVFLAFEGRRWLGATPERRPAIRTEASAARGRALSRSGLAQR
ncbi:MAG TPA: hypothetical protein VF161_10400 [Steroidobacteraceae bacterium]